MYPKHWDNECDKDKYVFNFLATMLSFFPQEKIRNVINLQEALTEEMAEVYEKEHGRIKKMVDGTAKKHYYFTEDEYKEMRGIFERYVREEDYVGILEVCKTIDRALGEFHQVLPMLENYPYSKWKLTIQLEPLNTNYEKTGIKLYPRVSPFWALNKAVMTRTLDLNRNLTNYWVSYVKNEQNLKIVPHYMKTSFFADQILGEEGLVVALSPIGKDVKIKFQVYEEDGVQKTGIDKIENYEETLRRIELTVDHALVNGANIIVFPEMLGGNAVEEVIRGVMEKHPGQPALCILPSYYEDRYNQVTLLGPGGQKIFTQKKATAFMPELGGKCYLEDIELGDEVHVLLIEGLGALVLPICADFLEGEYERVIYDYIPANTIICPSFSPGIGAFYETALRGECTYAMTYWLNTCAAEGCGVFNKNYGFDTVAFVQLPGGVRTGNMFQECRRTCDGKCSENICYFRMKITYEDGHFWADYVHEIA